MQAPLFCATCTTPLAFEVPELTGNRWHAHCLACGNATALEARLGAPEELATFNATGVYNGT
jgi:hypothetical protein